MRAAPNAGGSFLVAAVAFYFLFHYCPPVAVTCLEESASTEGLELAVIGPGLSVAFQLQQAHLKSRALSFISAYSFATSFFHVFFYRASRIVLKRLGVTDITPLFAWRTCCRSHRAGRSGKGRPSSAWVLRLLNRSKLMACRRAKEQAYRPEGSAAAHTSIRLFPCKGSFIECIRASVVAEQDMGITLNAPASKPRVY